MAAGLRGYVDTDVTFCFAIDGNATCAVSQIPTVPLDVVRPGLRIGWDLRGGFPCGGPITFD